MGKDTFLQGSICKPLVRFALPLMLSLVLQALYGTVDLKVVGDFGTTASVAAVTTGGQIMHAVTTIFIGITTGASILIAQAVGSGNKDRAANIAAGLVKLLTILVMVVTAIMLIFAGKIAEVLNVPEEAFDQTVTYLRICSAGIIFISAYNGIADIFRGLGNSLCPLLFILIACICNIILDYLFVGWFKMDVAGAALATVMAQALSVIFSLFYMKMGKTKIPFSRESFHDKVSAKSIWKLGSPIALQNSLTSVSFLMITGIVNSLGIVASASLGITERLFSMLCVVPMAFMSALSAFVGQNVGANQHGRAEKALRYGIIISLICGTITFVMIQFFGTNLASVFDKNPLVIATTNTYLRACSFEHLMLPIVFCFFGYFNGYGHTKFVMAQGLIVAFLVRVPLSYIFSIIPDTNMFIIGLAVPISALCSTIAGVCYFLFLKKRSLQTAL